MTDLDALLARALKAQAARDAREAARPRTTRKAAAPAAPVTPAARAIDKARDKARAELAAKYDAARIELKRAGYKDTSIASIERYWAAKKATADRSDAINRANIAATENKLGSKSNGAE